MELDDNNGEEDSTQGTQKFTDEVVLAAMTEIFKNPPSTTASKVAALLGANSVHMRRVMLDMRKRKVIKGKRNGKTWEFSFIK